MPESLEEEEKCSEKLNQMKKYLPFLDFMIDKIQKKNELSLECQLKKFQVLRSMIAEKNGRYAWNAIIKVEDVIQKLISKLDFKDLHEQSKQSSLKLENLTYQTSMTTTVSIIPSSTAAVSVATTASSRTKTFDSKPKDSSTNAVDLIVKNLKISVESGTMKNVTCGKESSSNSLDPVEVSGKSMDLDKDLDGFDLTDCPDLSEVEEPRGASAAPEKVLSHNDLLSSSREKLLKSLQSRLFPSGIPASSASSSVSKNEKSEPQSGALSYSQINSNERKVKSDVTENSNSKIENSKNSKPNTPNRNNRNDTSVKTLEKKITVVPKPLKSGSSNEKSKSDPTNSDVSLKQKLKEKFSTDICEVYRVPGKSVGGSLRSLKESKDYKKTSEEEELFKSNTSFEKGSPHCSKLFPEMKDNLEDKSHRELTQSTKEKTGNKINDQSSHKQRSGNSGRKKHDDKTPRSSREDVKNSGSKSSKDGKPSNKSEDKLIKLSQLKDGDELLGFVKENMQCFPQQSKMQFSKLKQTVQTSIACKLAGLDADAISEISDDSFQDLDDFVLVGVKTSNQLKSDSKGKNESKEFKTTKDGLDDVKGSESSKRSESENSGDILGDQNLNDEDYAMKLIEDTTPKALPPKKKKGLLELPMPITDDLFDEISSIDCFESFTNPKEKKDPRLRKNKSNENKSELNPELSQTAKEVSSNVTSSRLQQAVSNPHLPKETSHSSMQQTDKQHHDNQEKFNKQNQMVVDSNDPSFRKASSYSKPPCNNELKRNCDSPSKAKSYAEYKRRKHREREKAQKSLRSISSDGLKSMEVVRSSGEKEETERNGGRKVQDPRQWDSFPKQTGSKSSDIHASEARKSSSHLKPTSGEDFRGRKSYLEGAKNEDKTKKSSEYEELVSPLDELYGNEMKPKTGRGYGIQNFKIPKKGNQRSSQSNKNLSSNAFKKDEKINNVDSTKETKEPLKIDIKETIKEKEEIIVELMRPEESRKSSEKCEVVLIDTEVPPESDKKVEFSTTFPKTDLNINEKEPENSSEVVCSENPENTKVKHETNPEPAAIKFNPTLEVESKTGSDTDKTDVQETPKPITDAEEKVVTIQKPKEVLKIETGMVECDCSVETASPNEENFRKDVPGDKNTVVTKEEITQEFVEALIRKSFQSGEGKLLLAQMKLFEKFAKKLNSKKLKTIQKIINSECDSSFSSSETSSEDEKKKKKCKREEKSQKSKKRRKKGSSRKKNKALSSSSTSSSGSEESSDEEHVKEDKKESKSNEGSSSSALGENEESKILEFKTKTKNKRKNTSLEKNLGGGVTKRKKEQNKLLERILNEGSQPEVGNDSNPENVCEDLMEEPKQKSQKKTKAKVKTELDRLHDDIRNMFISEGVLTVTGQRMCRILKQSGGNMNNLDIVKESARMVEEEKLKKVVTRKGSRSVRPANAEDTENRSRSASLDKGKMCESHQDFEEEDPKLKLEPRVFLQRVDLGNFGYAVKISDDCVSFRRIKGRNRALKKTGKSVSRRFSKSPSNIRSVENVFLERNKRKFVRLKNSTLKRSYRRKKLMEVVKNLPLKMAKMKHLQIGEEKAEEKAEKEKITNQIFAKETEDRTELTNSELLKYAFDKKQKTYYCKLCSYVSKNITAHYQMMHPNSEVLISRLNLEEAKRAKVETKKQGYNIANEENNSLGTSIKNTVNDLLRQDISYKCRMCNNGKITDINSFASHVSAHTGEYRFKCPDQGCNIQRFSHEDMKFHVLTKHPRNRNDLISKIIELFKLVTINEKILLGFLCSKCHFVQICRNNVENHISRQHKDMKNVEIVKINMSGRKMGFAKKVTDAKNVKDESSNSETNHEKLSYEVENPTLADTKDGEEKKSSNRKREFEGETKETTKNISEEPNFETPEKKKLFLDKRTELVGTEKEKTLLENTSQLEDDKEKSILDKTIEKTVETEKKSMDKSERVLGEEEINAEENKEITVDDTCNASETEYFVDLRKISELKGSDIIKNMENPKKRDFQVEKSEKVPETCQKLKVGPLEVQILEKSVVLYKCSEKGCLFCTPVYDLFQKHVKISHWKTKWNGICEICNARKEGKPRGERTLQLSTALKHLKLHEEERFNQCKKSKYKPISCTNSVENVNVDKEDSERLKTNPTNRAEVKEDGTQAKQSTERSTQNFYPPKPLLRVRNFLGDRLSTPKVDENPLGGCEEDSNTSEPSTKMFTIENVRSLTEVPSEESGLRIEQVCSLKDQAPQPGTQLSSGKAILVRSCPTRKIAIRSEPSTIPVDVGHVNVVQNPVVSHPVVLSPISSNSPIRILSTPLSAKPVTVKPLTVPTDSARLNNSSTMPVVCPSVTPTVTSTAVLPITSSTDNKNVPHKYPFETIAGGGAQSKSSVEIERITSQTRSKSPSHSSSSTLHLSKNSPDQEEMDKRDPAASQRIYSNPNSGKKSVKDAKVYQQMLTRRKLCHLFKCMGIECSFTCNNENVFMQHIGLHEAQLRLERTKGMKTPRLSNKTADVFHWQQCAYCCEVLCNANNTLSQHILEEHGHCMYQCAFCFYRAISRSYVEIHQNLAHIEILKTMPRLIYKCKPLKVPPSQATSLEKHGRRQSVRPYHCDQCGQKFFITHDFTRHLATEHQSVTAYTCHICKNYCFKVNRLINHYKLHSYSTYQCAYCLHGTETEKEMVFHLSNFHFSQPAIMYVRALAEGKSGDEKHKLNKKKKNLSNQLDSLKVIVYESDTLSSDCVIEVEADEEITENSSPSSVELSAIVSELGISTDPELSSSSGVTPLMQELASIGDKTAKNLTVKSLLPNAQFSTENESEVENFSVLISSGLSIPSDQNDDREMSIPLGQLPLEAVNVQHKEATSPTAPPNIVSPPDRNLKLNEIIVNLHQKDKTRALSTGEEETIGQSAVILASAVHKLPPVVLTRTSAVKSFYPSKCAVTRKKSSEQIQNESIENDKELGMNQKVGYNNPIEKSATGDKTQQKEYNAENGNPSSKKPSIEKDTGTGVAKTTEPLITNVVSLSSSEFAKGELGDNLETPIIISNIFSLSDAQKEANSDSDGVVKNVKPKMNCPSALEPPVIRVEDFPIEKNTSTPSRSNENPDEVEKVKNESEKKKASKPSSPDLIVLDSKDIVTVTLDSDEEKDESLKKDNEEESQEIRKSKDDTIRKEMELLRNQIANETDSLLNDETEAEKPMKNLSLDVQQANLQEKQIEKTLLSPIEEAICTLNKKLQSETEEAQKKEKNEDDNPKKSNEHENKVSDRPRTRYGARDKRKDVAEGSDKSEGDESSKNDSAKGKKFKEDLVGKELFICGNEKCDFAADDDISLKDHLYVCDLSRDSSVLVCPHCSRQSKQFHPYLEHLRYHGEKKFHCGLCPFSSPVDSSTSRHVKQKHKCSVVKVLPKESKEGHFVCYPKNYRVEKLDFEVNGYSPGDEDKLPLQSVYQVNVKCAKCPYFTKVRSNMVRHLKIHLKSVETEGVVVVPSTAPTNPVPCLETKERMFDKMTNLAASSQLAHAKEKSAFESLSPEEEAKLPQFVAEQMRYKCCLPDCNYITVDDGMLKHHIKALHDEINYYSCPHCKETVHADVRHVTLDKIGYHLKHHDTKLYKCAHCIYFHYQKNVVEKHTLEKHPDRRYFVHTVREPKPEISPEEESSSSSDAGARVWKCTLCEEFRTPSKPTLMDHLLKTHNTKSKYKCQFCSVKGNSYQTFVTHFSSKHSGEKVSYVRLYYLEKVANLESQSGNSSGADSSNEHFDTTPLWQRGAPRIRHIRGILIEEEEIKTKKSKRVSMEESEGESSDTCKVKENVFYCPLCTNKKKPFCTRNEDFFRTHLYQELNYQQFACTLCGKMFADKKDFERHHARFHSDKPQAMKQTKEDHEIKFWVDQVIAKRKKQMEERKRKLSNAEENESQGPPKKKKEV